MERELRPIDSAPKDGTLVILYWQNPHEQPWEAERQYAIGFWSDPSVGDTRPEDSGWYATDISGNAFMYTPTHWAPLPQLKKETKTKTVGTLTYREGDTVIQQEIPIVDNGLNMIVSPVVDE